jgi:hypothetical protein
MIENALSGSVFAKAVPMNLPVSSQSVTASGSKSISGPGSALATDAPVRRRRPGGRRLLALSSLGTVAVARLRDVRQHVPHTPPGSSHP